MKFYFSFNMFSTNYTFFLKIVLIISYFIYSGSCRKISCSVNPGLDGNADEDRNANVVHIVSEGDKDTIHYVWSTYKLPSVIVARTTKNTTLSINTKKVILFEQDAIIFHPYKPLETVGLTFSKLWELNYSKDASAIKEMDSIVDLDMESLVWTDVNETLFCSDVFASAVLKANNSELTFSTNGFFEIQFSVSANQEISDEYPHLLFTGNSTLLKVVLDNLHSNFSKVRYGLGLSMFSTLSDECESDDWKLTTTESISDELSPGVFMQVQLQAPCSDVKKESSFISWRPVAYTGKVMTIANSSDVNMMEDPTLAPDVSILSIAELYFAKKSNLSSFNLTFGSVGDGFYPTTEYTEWSVMLGTGQMGENPMSLSIIILASTGIGLVLVFTVSGLIYILCQKCKEKDDDLLLN